MSRLFPTKENRFICFLFILITLLYEMTKIAIFIEYRRLVIQLFSRQLRLISSEMMKNLRWGWKSALLFIIEKSETAKRSRNTRSRTWDVGWLDS